jgi:nitrogen PTS system EIIA component
MNSNTLVTVLSPENTLCKLSSGSKKNLFEIVSKHIARDTGSNTWEEIFNALIAREKYGTTGFGNGIAIPHCRLKSCKKTGWLVCFLKNPH